MGFREGREEQKEGGSFMWHKQEVRDGDVERGEDPKGLGEG